MPISLNAIRSFITEPRKSPSTAEPSGRSTDEGSTRSTQNFAWRGRETVPGPHGEGLDAALGGDYAGLLNMAVGESKMNVIAGRRFYVHFARIPLY